MRFNNKGVKLSSPGHWANGVKEDGLTGLGFLTKYGFIGQDGQTEKKWQLEINGMGLKWVKGS